MFLVRARGVRGILKTPVMPVVLPRKHRASLISVAADRNHSLHGLLQELIHVFAVMRAKIDADFAHHFQCKRVHESGRFGAGAGHVEKIASGVAKDAFGEVAAARVARAQNEDRWFHKRRD